LLSITVPIVPVLVPAPRENATVAPPTLMFTPLASLACSVIVTLDPLATVDALTFTVDVAADGGPAGAGVTVIVGAVLVTAAVPRLAPMLRALPAVVAVNVAVYVPLALSVTEPIVPSLVPEPFVNVTIKPPVVFALPAASRVRSVSVAVAPT
jgi:hypothetical protein